MPYYVITQGWKVPESGGEAVSIRGVYDEWPSCLAAYTGSTDSRAPVKVSSREDAIALLEGRGVVLPPGLYGFTDGNSRGGVGVAIVRMADDEGAEPQVREIPPTSVHRVFRGAMVPGLESDEEVKDALQRLTMHLAELAAVYVAIRELPPREAAIIICDRKSVVDSMNRSPKGKHSVSKAIMAKCHELADDKQLRLTFEYKPGHRSTWAGRHDFAQFNALADELAKRGITSDNTD